MWELRIKLVSDSFRIFYFIFQKNEYILERIEWSEEDNTHVARCLEFPSLSAHGPTVKEALSEIEFIVEETLKWMHEEKEEIQR